MSGLKGSKASSSKVKNRKPAKPSSGGSSSLINERQSKSRATAQKNPKRTAPPMKKKKRVYTEKELGIPKLNMITPAGVQKPKGKKKGKVFVDDQESMMTILAMVNADKEGQIESKMMKARQLEEIREARKREAEARSSEKKAKLEDTKDDIRKKRRHRSEVPGAAKDGSTAVSLNRSKKRVSFG